jgi:hypothetical protein
MIEAKNLQDVTAALREIYNRATAAGRKKNWDYAIELMLNVLAKEPALEPARKELRKYEEEKSGKLGFFAKLSAQISASIKVPKLKVLAKKEPFKAMQEYEKLLGKYLFNPLVLNGLADAAASKGAYFISIQALEIIHDRSPRNEANLRKLADYYKEIKDGMAYLRIFQEIGNMHPGNLEIEQEVRSALAFSSMHEAKWDKESSTQEKAQGDIAGEEIAEGTLHDASQAEILVKRLSKQLEERESSDTRRKLAEAYLMLKDYDQAIEQLNTVQKNLGVMDPSIDKLIERAYLSNIDDNIEELTNNPDQYEEPEAQLQDLREHRLQYRMQRAVERVENYPNDAQLHYDLAMLYFETENYDYALEEFQKARRNPQRRLSCIVHLGRCFLEKGQDDMAVGQLEEVLKELPELSEDRFEALYYLGIAHEALGNGDQALKCFKEIYQNNVNYKDVGKRIKEHYQ